MEAGAPFKKLVRLALLASPSLAPVLHYWFGLPGIWVFITGIVAVGMLADWFRAVTEQLARHTSPAIGGLLIISLGSLAELFLALFVLTQGQPEVVHAQITDSIIKWIGPLLASTCGWWPANAWLRRLNVLRVWDGQRQPEQAQHTAAERLGLSQGQVEHEPQGQHEFDGQFGVQRSSSSHSVRSPRRRSPASYADQFVTR